MKKLSLNLKGEQPKMLSKDEMKKVKGAGEYGCPPVDNPPDDCMFKYWSCMDLMSPLPECIGYITCSEEDPTNLPYTRCF